MKYLAKPSNSLTSDTKVDLTSMLDMVFILIIFFIVSASFTHEPGVNINRPSAAPPISQQASETPIFTISASDAVHHNGYDLEITNNCGIIDRQTYIY